MAVQAPNTRLGLPRQYGLEERIRELMAQRQMSPVGEQPDELAPFRSDDTQRIVRDGEREEVPPVDLTPTADEIIRDEVGPRPAPPRPFPQTAAERVADLRKQLNPQFQAMQERARARTGPVMTIDGEPEGEGPEIPDPIAGFRPPQAEPNRLRKPGASRIGGSYVAPGMTDAGGRALGQQRREESEKSREKNEATAAEKARNEAALAAEDADLDAWGAGADGKPGTDDDNMLFTPDPETGELVNTGRDHPNRLDEDGRRLDRPQGVGDAAWRPAAPGTGYRARKPGEERRIGANEQERGVPMTDRRLPDSAGNRPPMLPGKGQSVVRGGGMSPRAPQQGIIDNLPKEFLTAQEPADQGKFFQWREAMKALAMASGVNIAAFEDEEELVRAGKAIAEQYDRMNAPVTARVPKMVASPGPDGELGTADDAQVTALDPNGNVILTSKASVDKDGKPVSKYERTITSTGAPAYTPSAAMRESADAARRRAAARQFVREHKPDETTGNMILEAADVGDFDTVDSLVRGARRDRTASTSQAAMDQSRLRGQTQNMNNPNINRAMWHESVMKQPNAAGVAQVGAAWNVPGSIPAMTTAEAVAAEKEHRKDVLQNNVDVANATAEGRNKNPDGLKNYQLQVNGILTSSPDPITAINQLRKVNAAAAEGGIIPKQDLEYETHAEVSRNEILAGRGPNNFATQNGLRMLFDKVYNFGTAIGRAVGAVGDRRQEFLRRAQLDLGCDEATADAYLSSRGQ